MPKVGGRRGVARWISLIFMINCWRFSLFATILALRVRWVCLSLFSHIFPFIFSCVSVPNPPFPHYLHCLLLPSSSKTSGWTCWVVWAALQISSFADELSYLQQYKSLLCKARPSPPVSKRRAATSKLGNPIKRKARKNITTLAGTTWSLWVCVRWRKKCNRSPWRRSSEDWNARKSR